MHDTPVRVAQLCAEPAVGKLGLTVLAGQDGLGRVIGEPRVQKPGLALTGFTEYMYRDRALILGGTEMAYLRNSAPEQRTRGIQAVMAVRPPCVVVTRGQEAFDELIEACAQAGVTLLSTHHGSAEFIGELTKYLKEQMAPSTSLHGVLLDVLGVGVLLLGKSGVGKSEIALELVTRGHRLVADDIVNIRMLEHLVYGSGSGIIRHHMEIRGLGIINIKDLFGIASVRDAKKIELVIELCEWDASEEYDRLGIDERSYRILGLDIPMVRLPVRPGRNMATIVEVAARNQLLKFQGHFSAREFQERLNRAIALAEPRATFDIDTVE